MKLLKIEITGFGRLSEYQLELSDGLNVICEPNGFGKTTLAAFIKAMLYGLPVTKKRNLDENERKKYTPWQGGTFGGSLEFECANGRFRIERFFGAKEADDEFRLFDLSTNKPSTVFSADVGLELLGIDAEGFERSIFLAQNGMDARGGNDSVTAKLTGLLEDVNDIGGYEIAVKAIDKRRQFYERTGNRGRIAELNAERTEITAKLEDCKRLLPQQESREARLNGLRAQIRESNEALKRIRQQKSESDVRAERVKELENTRKLLQDREAERGTILDSFRDRALPTDAELSQAREQLKALRTEQAELQRYRLSDQESERLSELRARFSRGVPSPKTLESLQAVADELPELNARLSASEQIPLTPDQKHFAQTGIPSDAALADAEEKFRHAEQVRQTLAAERARPLPTPKRRISLALTLPPIAIGALLTLIGALFSLPLAAVGAVLLAVGVILSLVGGKKRDDSAAKAREERLLALEADYRKSVRLVTDVLTKYGCLPQNGDLRAALTELALLARRARADEVRQSAQERAQATLREQIASHRKFLSSQFSAMGYAEPPRNPSGELSRIRSEIAELSRLSQREHQLSEQGGELNARLAQKKSDVSAFLSRMSGHDGNSPEDRLSAIVRACDRHALLLGELRRLKEELHRRSSETVSVDSALPSAAELTRTEEEQDRRLSELRQAESEELRALNRLYEETVRIPEWEDQLRHVTEEWETARENLETLRATAKLLEEAKTALSTRYLGGMQESFSKYLALLDGEDAKQAVLDVSFDVSVREGGKSRALESFSRGSKDVLQFCARLSLAKALFSEGEEPFLVLDDPFVNLDGEHLAEARAMLDRLSRELQILYLVCHDSRK